MQNRFCESVEAVATVLREGRSGPALEAEYVSASLPESPGGLKGCMNHPNLEEDAAMVQLIAPAVANVTGWALP